MIALFSYQQILFACVAEITYSADKINQRIEYSLQILFSSLYKYSFILMEKLGTLLKPFKHQVYFTPIIINILRY